jgi:predicted nucleic acid-binding protein
MPLRNKQIRIILDTNLWISFLISHEQGKLDLLLSSEKVSLLFSERLFAEFKTTQTQCRDPKDNFLLELAVDGKADYLVTGDNDLLTLQTVANTQIIKIQDFFDILR